MRRIVRLSLNILFLMLLIFVQACNQESAFDCAKSTGTIIREERGISPFNYLIIEDNIDLVLINGDSTQAAVEAGENLMPKINFRSQNDTLIISNQNTCNWVRSFKHRITVYISVPHNDLSLVHRGYGQVSSSEQLQIDNLSIYSLDAGGNISLQLTAGNLVVYSNSHSFINLSGQATNLDIWMHKGIGRVFAEQVMADICHVKHEGSNQIRIFPVLEGNIEILASGNVEYYNEPITLKSTIKGTGKLIKK